MSKSRFQAFDVCKAVAKRVLGCLRVAEQPLHRRQHCDRRRSRILRHRVNQAIPLRSIIQSQTAFDPGATILELSEVERRVAEHAHRIDLKLHAFRLLGQFQTLQRKIVRGREVAPDEVDSGEASHDRIQSFGFRAMATDRMRPAVSVFDDVSRIAMPTRQRHPELDQELEL